jgi:preprotein translocase subunit SecD
MRNATTVSLAVGVVAGLVSLGVLGLYVARRAESSLLSKPPEHGVCFTLQSNLSDLQATNGIPQLREAIRQRFEKVGARIFWEQVSPTEFRVYTPVVENQAVEAAEGLAWQRGHLDFRLVHADNANLISQDKAETGYELLQLRRPEAWNPTNSEPLWVQAAAEGASGIRVRQASGVQNASGRGYDILIKLTPESADTFRKITRDNVGRRLAIVTDGVVLAAPIIRSEIPGGQAMISGDFDRLKSLQMAALLEVPLPAPVKLVGTKSF